MKINIWPKPSPAMLIKHNHTCLYHDRQIPFDSRNLNKIFVLLTTTYCSLIFHQSMVVIIPMHFGQNHSIYDNSEYKTINL